MLQLQATPLPPLYFPGIVEIYTLAFAGGNYARWMAKTPADGIVETADDIPPSRLQKTMREIIHQEWNPRVVLVCALSDGKVIGYSLWILPACLSRTETLPQFIYRKAMEHKDSIEDWLFPQNWRNQRRFIKFCKAQAECADNFLGKGRLDETWYLKILAVHPEFQRRGVGGELLDWGLKQAQERGENIYLESSEVATGFYLKKGFKVLGMMVVEDKGDELIDTCMLWTPSKIMKGLN